VTSQRTHVRVGVFVLAAVVVIVGVIVTFGGMHWFEARDHYAVELRESVTGLETGATVSFDGIAVGRVDSINVSPTDLGAVRVELSVKAGTPVHTDTVAYVTMAGLTGLKTIFDTGKLALIQRTGYENSSRSHFQGTDIWSTANVANTQGAGWLGRYLDSLPSPVDPLVGWSTTRDMVRESRKQRHEKRSLSDLKELDAPAEPADDSSDTPSR